MVLGTGAMTAIFKSLLLLGIWSGFSSAQNCPLLGPAYPPVRNISSSTAFQAAKINVDELISEALANGQLDNQTAIFSVAVFSIDSGDPVYEYHHATPDLNITLNSDSIYRIGSISKLITVYAILSKLGNKYWEEPVTKFVPELSSLPKPDSLLDDVDWSEITLGALSSQMSGIGRDYSIGDFSAIPPEQTVMPGLPPLHPSERVSCGSAGFPPCNRKEAFAKIVTKPPVTLPYQTPIYSNMAYQILAYAVENITKQSFSSLVRSEILKPLKLTRTFLTQPPNDTNAVIVSGYDLDIGDEAPAGGYYQSLSDLSVLGRSILKSSLLRPRLTRQWLKPVSHTSSLTTSVGRPWEIFREKVLTVPQGNKTRVVDVYTKNGGIEAYISHVGLSPDHGLGIAVLTAGGVGQAGFFVLQGILYKAWFEAAEAAGREAVEKNFAGTYKFHDNSTAEFKLDETGEPGLLLSRLVSNGTDLLAAFGRAFGIPEGVNLVGWLYPTLIDKNRVAFRAVYGAAGVNVSPEDRCLSWGSVDQLRYGGHALDLFVFEVDKKGKATAVRVDGLQKTFKRA